MKRVGPPQKVPEGFVSHSPMWHLNWQMGRMNRKGRQQWLKYWARVFGLPIVQLKEQFRNAQ